MHVAGAVIAEFDAARFQLVDDARNIFRRHDGAGFGIRHQAARTQDAGDRPNFAHHWRYGDGGVKFQPAVVANLVDDLVRTDDIGAGCQSGLFVLLIDESQNADGLAGAVRQHYRCADLLVAVAGVDAEPEMRFDCLVEFGFGVILDQLERLVHRIIALAFKGLERVFVAFSHYCLSSWSAGG